jgi:c(7)-type cytochrome triheme protein
MNKREEQRNISSVRSLLLGPISTSALLFLFGVAFTLSYVNSPAAASENDDVTTEPVQDFSKFRHDTQQHTRMPCLVCHVLSNNSPALKMPGHIPCASCHSAEFAKGNASPICAICHTETDVKRFPPLRSFNAVFDHGRHVRQTSCSTCHRPANRGVALSIPARSSGHSTCFQCHQPQTMIAGKNIGSCSTCHKPGSVKRTSESARAFSMNFSHAEHARKGLSCSDCHTVRPGARRGAQVSSPQPAMHLARPGIKSCSACHNNTRAFGDENFANCRRCHEGKSFKF